MKTLKHCEFNVDTRCVEAVFTDGNKRFYNKCWGQVKSLTPFVKKQVEHRDKIGYCLSTPTKQKGDVSMLNSDYTTKLLNLKAESHKS